MIARPPDRVPDIDHAGFGEVLALIPQVSGSSDRGWLTLGASPGRSTTFDRSRNALNVVDRTRLNDSEGRARQSSGVPSCAQTRPRCRLGPQSLSVEAGLAV